MPCNPASGPRKAAGIPAIKIQERALARSWVGTDSIATKRRYWINDWWRPNNKCATVNKTKLFSHIAYVASMAPKIPMIVPRSKPYLLPCHFINFEAGTSPMSVPKITKDIGSEADSGEGAMVCPARAETAMIITVPIWKTVWVMEKIPRTLTLFRKWFINQIIVSKCLVLFHDVIDKTNSIG
ncbi:hypothetical protein LEP1GSC202_1424 [Leptospira yanagawae serovar Saopaulo str. Sao Paulo = ATCC 700523]|uniref:Uncharacterized protein n=1 Tax=Leptospira yanagawae serovar Saopaulo str. Sao Paulo = ATCC 700523 TaxID=1249483 RepID=A0A5E8HFA2_9LEPT|nr:hypothetical protein [Leptospira yanagawae]EOQ89477.1 hypothetical protein LEP1GSC202_1424 [Leptospira yanagawae serovar Saopaulo str. Sao Paulo = ATCC 700523]